MKKKVLHIVEAFGGGIFTFLVDLINSTCDEYEIVLACAIRPQTPQNYKEYFNRHVRIVELKSGEREINFFKDIKLLFEIKSIIKSESPDIIHLHSSKAGFLGRILGNNKKFKVVYNPHGFSFLREDENKFKKKIYRFLEFMAAKKCGVVVAVSKGELEEASNITDNYILINNGINTKSLPDLNEKDMNIEKIKICTIGRITYQKNPILFNEIAKKFPNIEFTWIGTGEMKDYLDSSNIKITGWMSKDEVLRKMNECDIFLLTSLWEGLPIALLEAMYYKKVCIVSNCIGNRDVIINGVNGFIANNIEEFSKLLIDIISSESNIEEIKENAHTDIVEGYNFDKVSNEYIKLYKSI